jgi:hypothetical protein
MSWKDARVGAAQRPRRNIYGAHGVIWMRDELIMVAQRTGNVF